MSNAIILRCCSTFCWFAGSLGFAHGTAHRSTFMTLFTVGIDVLAILAGSGAGMRLKNSRC